MTHPFRSAAGSVALLLILASPAAAGTLYGAASSGQIFVVDESTGAGAINCTLPVSTTEIEYNNTDGTAFLQLPGGSDAGEFFDLESCAIDPAVPNGHEFNGLEYVDAILYGTSIEAPLGPSSLRTLDPATGISALIGLTGVGPIVGLAYDADAATMYGISGVAGNSDLYTVNLTTGVATLVGNTGMQAGSLEFGNNGRLFAGGTGVNSGELWRIDPATGAGTLVGATGFLSITGLTFRTTLDHFLCYKTKGKEDVDVSLADQFETGTYAVSSVRRFCTPSDKEGEGTNDPATHIEAYKLKGTHVARTGVLVSNQFGAVLVDTKKTDSLLVPSAKSISPDPPPGLPDPANLVDHYRCVTAKISKGTPKFPKGLAASVADQFGTRNVTLKKPATLCVPTDKNGEGINRPDDHLLCYKIKPSVKTSASGVQVQNQFAAQVLDLKSEAQFCVPSLKSLTCGDDTADGGAEECDGSDLAGESCATVGFAAGTLACGQTCQFDTSACTP